MERQLLSQGELDKRSEKDGAEILELRRQLMEQFEANKALISENSELSDHNLKLTSSVSELKGFREELAKKKAKHDVKQVARETQTENESVEIGVGLDEKGEALLRAAAFAEGEGNRASVATETTSEIEILCTKCESKKELTVAVKSPKGAAKKAARTPKARIILEAKVLQVSAPHSHEWGLLCEQKALGAGRSVTRLCVTRSIHSWPFIHWYVRSDRFARALTPHPR